MVYTLNLNHVVDEGQTTIWHQEWKTAQQIGIAGIFMATWHTYIQTLHHGHLRLKEEWDELIWHLNRVSSQYTAKLGYDVAVSNKERELIWRWSKLWHVHAGINEQGPYMGNPSKEK